MGDDRDEADEPKGSKAARGPQGRFPQGRSGNPKGRPPKRAGGCIAEAVRRAQAKRVPVSVGGASKQMRKLDLAATQLANMGAAGDRQAIKLAADLTREAKACDAATPEPLQHSETTLAIVARVVRRIRGEPFE